jgi:hypothetical protein
VSLPVSGDAPTAPTPPAPPAVTTSATAVISVSPTVSSASVGPVAVASTSVRKIGWGVCGHPTWSDYANWTPANVTTQVNYLNQLGCKFYRCSFEGATGPSILANIVPAAQAAGITVLPILPISPHPSSTAQANHDSNYQMAYTWASYAISKHYNLTYWELGNELENWGNLVDVVSDGTSPNDFPDANPGGFVSIASSLNGAYQGIKDAFSAGRASGLTTITPQVLFGACYRHWGLLTKIQNYNGSLPFDIISWHWYGPVYGSFTAAINNTASASNGLTPVQCLNAFKSHTNPGQPMDIWITETNRSQKTSTGDYLNGSVAAVATPTTSQDWAAEAQAIQTNVDNFKTVPTVKAIFVYELLDESHTFAGETSELASDGYFGLVTGLNGTLKNAFYTYQTEIKQGP